jgi:membrane-associated phospholipid phosphatase
MAAPSQYRPRLLLAAHAFFGVALISFLLPSTGQCWTAMDEQGFYLFNGSLEGRPDWQLFWGTLNHLWERKISPVIMLTINAIYVIRTRDKPWQVRIAPLLFFWLYMEATIPLMSLSIRKGFGFYRSSPSMVMEPVIRLSHVLENPMIRDISNNSFPSGHAFTHAFWATFTTICCGRPYATVAWTFAIFNSLPRLFAGAHWISDCIFSVLLAMMILSWATATPFHRWGSEKIQRLLYRISGEKRRPDKS